jgi:CubicO group peptidase (beta-lactamase class C family)
VDKAGLVWGVNYDGPAGLDSTYIVGSVTKPFTATAALQLYEQGMLDLDADISRYLPFDVRNPREPNTPLTTRMLLAHTSGLASDNEHYTVHQAGGDNTIFEFFEDVFEVEVEYRSQNQSRDEFYKELLVPGGEYYSRRVWSAKTGTHRYSNIGYGLLAFLVQNISGEKFEDYVVNHILKPLGMSNSGFVVDPTLQAKPYSRIRGNRIRSPYRRITLTDGDSVENVMNHIRPAPLVPVPAGINPQLHDGYIAFPHYQNLGGNGGLRTSVADLSQFLAAHMNHGTAPNGYQLLTPESVDLMHSIQAKAAGTIDIFPLEGYGLGWSVCENGVQGHIGGALGYIAVMLMQESTSAGMILLVNMDWRFVNDADVKREFFTSYYLPIEEALLNGMKTLERGEEL